MEPKPIKDYLLRFLKIRPVEKEQKQICLEVVSKEISIPISISQIRIQQGVVRLSMSALPKMELFLDKHRILEKINKQLLENNLPTLKDLQ